MSWVQICTVAVWHRGVRSDTQILQMNLILDHHLRRRHSAEEVDGREDDHACVPVEVQQKKSGNRYLVRKAVFLQMEKKKLKALINKMAGVSLLELEWLLAAASSCVMNLTALGQHL